MDVARETQRQMDAIRARATEIVPEDELRTKLERALADGRPLRIKYGIDPTNPDIHIGHLVPCRLIRTFQELGHTAVLIVGDYTARIGDPTGRNAERPPLSEADVERNMELYAPQLFTVVDDARAELHYQSSWFGSLPLSDTLRLVASFSVAQMLAHETFRTRLNAGRRLSLHELLYPVLQAYDSLMVQADVEIGGTDQRFNCLCGRDLQREAGADPQVVVTVPLLRGPDGEKMSKSRDNHVPLSSTATETVGRIMSLPDELLEEYVRLATDWPESEREGAVRALRAGTANPRDLKLRVAAHIAAQLRGEDVAREAVAEFERVFSRREHPSEVARHALEEREWSIVDLLIAIGFVVSRSEGRRLVAQGGVRVNDRTVETHEERVAVRGEEAILVRAGRRRFAEVIGGQE
ncbi:MAG: tyrosine--tRNA ligase [Spirochaetota bacterium]